MLEVAVVLLVSCSRLVVAVSSCGGPCLKSVLVSYDKSFATGKSGAFNDRARPILKMGKIWRLFGEPLGHVITLCGQFLVSSTCWNAPTPQGAGQSPERALNISTLPSLY